MARGVDGVDGGGGRPLSGLLTVAINWLSRQKFNLSLCSKRPLAYPQCLFDNVGAVVYLGWKVGGGCWFIEMRNWLWIECIPGSEESRCKRRHPTGPHRHLLCSSSILHPRTKSHLSLSLVGIYRADNLHMPCLMSSPATLIIRFPNRSLCDAVYSCRFSPAKGHQT